MIIPYPHRFAVAPMIDWTDRHCRYFHRLLSNHALLYTEMITTGAILHGDQSRFLSFHPAEHPIALQLGGSDPQALANCAEIGAAYGYDEINLNVGCPSARVQNGRFGACLMKEPLLVAECIQAMQARVNIPITVKTRLGIDQFDDYAFVQRFIQVVGAAGCQHFILHARKAWLNGLSPKENRAIPPLQYPKVYQLAEDFPNYSFSINGGIQSFAEIHHHLTHVDGVMLGRSVYHNPYLLSEVDAQLYGTNQPIKTRDAILSELLPYLEQQYAEFNRIEHVTRHILGLWHGLAGARAIRQHLSDSKMTSAQKLTYLKALIFS